MPARDPMNRTSRRGLGEQPRGEAPQAVAANPAPPALFSAPVEVPLPRFLPRAIPLGFDASGLRAHDAAPLAVLEPAPAPRTGKGKGRNGRTPLQRLALVAGDRMVQSSIQFPKSVRSRLNLAAARISRCPEFQGVSITRSEVMRLLVEQFSGQLEYLCGWRGSTGPDPDAGEGAAAEGRVQRSRRAALDALREVQKKNAEGR